MTFAQNSGKGAAMKQLVALVLVVGLAGCADAPAPHMFCPDVRVLAEAQNYTAFLPGRTDVAAQVTSAQITGVSGACVLRKKPGLLDVTLQAGFSASNGPADHGAPLALPYFVALAQGPVILHKQLYSMPLTFDGNTTVTSAVSKPVKVELPNEPESAGIEVLVGFQLSPQQLSAAANPAPGISEP